jgi:heptosyltransferase I
VKPSSLGDVVHTLPVVRAIKRCYPSCYVGWIVQRPFHEILSAERAIDEIIPIHIPSTSDPLAGRGTYWRATAATLRVLRELRTRFREKPYDVVLDLHASFRSGLIGLTNPNSVKIGFADAKELNTRFQDYVIDPGPERIHAVDKNLAFAEYLGCPVVPEDFRLVVDPRAQERVHSFLLEGGVQEGDRIVYANSTARWETKFWTIEGWAELADLLVGRSKAAVVFAGSAADVPYIEQITGRMKGRALVAAGKLNLAEAAALMARSDVYVGVDSGPMHVAAFVGIPVGALFGPTEPEKVGPYGQGHKVIYNRDVDCIGCRKRRCNDRKCLEELKAETVFDETVELLGWQ